MQEETASIIQPFPARERLRNTARLKALDATGLMDTPPEEAFDRAVRMAQRHLATPMGLLSLVDGERHFLKAQIGMPDQMETGQPATLTQSFCQHIVATDAPLAIRDARNDPLVKDKTVFPDPDLVAFLGVPIHAPDGYAVGSLCALQPEPRDWTQEEREALQDIANGIETEISLRAKVAHSAKMEARASAAKERLRLALRAGNVGTWDFDPQTQTAHWDDELYSIWGLSVDETDIFSAIQRSIHPDDLPIWEADVAASLDPGGTGQHDLELRITRPDNGDLRWLHATGKASFENGVPVRLIGTVSDITARKEAEEREGLLTQELHHRVKNLFAIVSGMINITARNSDTPKQMASSLSGRVQALASAHALIQPSTSGEEKKKVEVPLPTLAKAILKPHLRSDAAATFSGPPVTLNPAAASNIALVLHELATNATKYGALSAPSGKLAISWEILGQVDGMDGQVLRLFWSETGGPEIPAPPVTEGFGSKLIELTVANQMRGSKATSWDRGGVRHELLLPISYLS